MLFGLNLVINYLLLIASAKLSGAVIERKRILMGSLIGAVYAVVMFFPSVRFLYSAAFKIFSAVPIVLVSFGLRSIRSTVKQIFVFFAVSFAFAGCVTAIYYIQRGNNIRVSNGIMYMNIPFWMLVISVTFSYILIGIIMRKSAADRGSGTVDIEIRAFSGFARLTALCDSGNELTDPMTNKKILVADYSAVREVFPEEARVILDRCDLLDGADAVSSVSRFCSMRVVPYKTVGNKSALMAVFNPKTIKINGKKYDDILIGLSKTKFSDCYSAVINI